MLQIECAAEACEQVNVSVRVDANRTSYLEAGWVEDEANDFFCTDHAESVGGAGLPLPGLNLHRL